MKSDGKAAPSVPKKRAILIGINRYQGDIPQLVNAVSDVRSIAAILADHHGYDVCSIEDEAATLTGLRTLFAGLPTELGREDRLVLYFAGHGIADSTAPERGASGSPQGYLIPVDARRDRPDSFLPMAEVQNTLDRLPCRHVLVCLDCCFAGAFRWTVTRDMRVKRKPLYRERVERYLRASARQVIVSAGADERALDVVAGRVFGQREADGHNSPFAAAMCAALMGRADLRIGDARGDGIVVASELHLFIEEALKRLEERTAIPQQRPLLWSLPGHDKGEFVFLTDESLQALPSALALSEQNSPYRGLAPFDEAHQRLFFGRRAVVEELTAKVTANTVVTVVGASGTGKTSLVCAGLLPALRKQGAASWRILPVVRPERQPRAALARLVAALEQPEGTSLEAALALCFDMSADCSLLIVVDQLEELITMAADSAERQALLDTLLRITRRFPQRLRVVLTLRSDFEPQFADFLAQSCAARLLLKPMSREELRDAIELPAVERVLYFEPPGLVDEIIDELIDMPGALPLLSFTLSELYLAYLRSGREDRVLHRDDYVALGQGGGALSKRADRILHSLDAPHQQTLKRLMLRMTSMSGGELARRRASLRELEVPKGDPEAARIDRVVACLVEARLIVAGKDSQGDSYLEPAHDKLLLGWQALWSFLKEDQEFLPLLKRVSQAAADWESAGFRSAALWSNDPRLPQAVDWQRREPARYNRLEADFVRASEGRRMRQRRLVFVAIGLLVLTLSTLTALSFVERRQAVRAQAQAQAQTRLAEERLHDSVEVGEALINTVDRKLGPLAGVAPIRRELLDTAERLLDKLVRGAQERPSLLRLQQKRLVQEADLLLKSQVRSQLSAAEDHYRKALALAERTARLEPQNLLYRADVADGHAYLGRVLFAAGRYEQAEAAQLQAVAIFEALIASAPTDRRGVDWQVRLTSTQGELCDTRWERRGRSLAEPCAEETLKAFESLQRRSPRDLDVKAATVGAYLRICKFYPMAQPQDPGRAGRDCYSIDAQPLAEQLMQAAPYRSDFQEQLADIYEARGQRAADAKELRVAEHLFEKSIALRKALVQANPENAMFRYGLSQSYRDIAGLVMLAGRLEEARTLYQQGLDLVRGLTAADPSHLFFRDRLAEISIEYAALLRRMGLRDGAEARYEEALAALDRSLALSGDNVDLVRRRFEVLVQLGDDDGSGSRRAFSVGYFVEAVATAERWRRLAPLDQAASLAGARAQRELAGAQLAAGRHKEALATCEQSLKVLWRLQQGSSRWDGRGRLAEHPIATELRCLAIAGELGDASILAKYKQRVDDALSALERDGAEPEVLRTFLRQYQDLLASFMAQNLALLRINCRTLIDTSRAYLQANRLEEARRFLDGAAAFCSRWRKLEPQAPEAIAAEAFLARAH